MSATPIPRTLAMTFFADLDVSVIDELPPGRTPVVTKLVSDARREVIAHIAQAARAAVRPTGSARWSRKARRWNCRPPSIPTKACGPICRTCASAVHGRLPQAEKAAVMQAFREGEVDLLVATTVIEVGVDVPNASMMVIEHAERFGLAQLHQLRGRVGRGTAESVCVLLYQTPLSQIARERLRAMFETSDGFEIARRDLEQRGPGNSWARGSPAWRCCASPTWRLTRPSPRTRATRRSGCGPSIPTRSRRTWRAGCAVARTSCAPR